ncbi:MAG: hypothetical protein ACTSP5_03585, partial [Candidatus Heimdallarchaeota archaeon]
NSDLMPNEQLVAKLAADRNSKKLGTIIKIEQITGKTVKTANPHAIIRVRKFMKDDVLIPIEVEKVIEVNDKYVLFDLLKADFEKEVKKQRILKEQKELYDGKSPLTYGSKVRSSLSPMAGKLPETKSRRK